MIRFVVFTFFVLQIINGHSMVKGDEGHPFGGRGGGFPNWEGFPMSLFQLRPPLFFPQTSQFQQIKDVIENLFPFLRPQPDKFQFTPNFYPNPNPNHNSNHNHNSYPNPNPNPNPNHNSNPNPYLPTNPQTTGTTSGSNSQPPPLPAPTTAPTVPTTDPGSSNPTANTATP